MPTSNTYVAGMWGNGRRDLRKAALVCGKRLKELNYPKRIPEWVLLSLFIRLERLDVPYVGVLDCFLRRVSSGWFECEQNRKAFCH
jgi:hypothetical protein